MAPLHLETLGDAHRNRLELLAICRNVACRHRQLVDLGLIIAHVGADHPLVPQLNVSHFSDRMRCSVCGSLGVFLWPGQAKRFLPIWDESLSYSVETWDREGKQLERYIARLRHVTIAHAAYESALAVYPARRITLRQHTQLIEDSSLRVIKGGKS